MSDDRKDLPPVTAPNFLEKVRETLSVYLGNRGNGLDRGVTLRDLTDAQLVALRPGFGAGTGGTRNPIAGPGSMILDVAVDEPDLTPPPTPSGFAVSAAISNLLVSCDSQTYPQGHGHAKSKLYGAQWTSGPLPVFADAVVITEFSGTVASHATNPATTWRLWLTWVTVDGVESTVPAGGTNGLVTRTGEDMALLLTALAGSIRASELSASLSTPIGQIPGIAQGTANNAAALTTTNTNVSNLNGVVTAQSASITTLSSTVTGNNTAQTAALQVEATTRATQTGELYAQYTVKLDVGGKVSGYGLASTGPTGSGSTFEVRADKFVIAAPTGAAAGYVPFAVLAVPTVIGGITLPAGVYAQNAFIQDAQITRAKIANLAVDDAKIANLSVGKLTAGSIAVGQFIQSTGYVAGSAGWRINGDGTAEYSQVVVRGTVFASQGLIGGWTIGANYLRSNNYALGAGGTNLNADGTGQIGPLQVLAGGVQSFNYSANSAGFRILNNGSVEFNNALFRGNITASNVSGSQFTTGSYTGYAWPPAGQFGTYLGPSGLLIGNANNGRFFQVTADGNLYSPGFYVESGVLTVTQANVINTLNIAGNAVSVSASASGANSAATNITVPAGVTATVFGISVGNFTVGSGGTQTSTPHSITISGSTFSTTAIRQIGIAENTFNWHGSTVAGQVTVSGPVTVSISTSRNTNEGGTLQLIAIARWK